MIKGIVAGAVGVVVLGLLGAYLFVSFGCMPANADGKPPLLEKWAARKSLNATIAREEPKTPSTVPPTDENLLAGVKLYAANCLVCHGAADAAPSNIAKGLYQHAPQLAKHPMRAEEWGETYWKIFHGIRMTGMPSYGAALSEGQIWQLTEFLTHMDQLTPGAQKAWKSLPSQAAAR